MAPVFEVRSGFPYSVVDENLNFVGPRNRAGRFPTFGSLDVQVTKSIKVPMLHKTGQVGIKLFNITGRDNPRDFQNNLSATDFRRLFQQHRNPRPREVHDRFLEVSVTNGLVRSL
jgi:hypothetical protein